MPEQDDQPTEKVGSSEGKKPHETTATSSEASMSSRPYLVHQASTQSAGSEREDSDSWAHITDPTERRKIQNKLAQRKFRQKAKEAKEEADRQEENRRKAGAAYVAPDPNALAPEGELSGLPWGGVSFKHIMETGKTKEQQSQQSSRESSVYAAASRTGGSSR